MSASILSRTLWIFGIAAIAPLCITGLAATPDGSSKINPRDGLSYEWIAPGSYYTGCLPGDAACYGLERHREKITIGQGFWIGRTEVTQAAYSRIMHSAPRATRALIAQWTASAGTMRQPTAVGLVAAYGFLVSERSRFSPLGSRRPLALIRTPGSAPLPPAWVTPHAPSGITPGPLRHSDTLSQRPCSGNCLGAPFVACHFYNIVELEVLK